MRSEKNFLPAPIFVPAMPQRRYMLKPPSAMSRLSLSISEMNLHCNHVRINLRRRPLAMRILAIFLTTPGFRVTREQILQDLFGEEYLKNKSARFVYNKNQNLNKMISRMRILLRNKLTPHLPGDIYWFYHVMERDEWLLFRLPGQGSDGLLYS